jgi:hypothetical protein
MAVTHPTPPPAGTGRVARRRMGALAVGAAAALWAAPDGADAALLDPLLQATPPRERLTLELSYDQANRQVDVFGLRAKSAAPGSVPGDYSGGHARLQWVVVPGLTLDGSFWRRRIDYQSFSADIGTWQLAGQWHAVQADGLVPHIAVRAGLWGNSADELQRATGVTIQGVRFTRSRLTDPRDRQTQLDLLATWPVAERWSLTTRLGIAFSRTNFRSAHAIAQQDGCAYDVSFTATHVTAVCENARGTIRLSVPNEVYGVDVGVEARYRSRMVGAGLGVQWQGERWRGALGYGGTWISRDNVDRIIEARGGTAYRTNHVVMAEAAWRWNAHVEPFIRGQIMSNQFNGESPVTYNTFTANRFSRPYGLLMTGVLLTY